MTLRVLEALGNAQVAVGDHAGARATFTRLVQRWNHARAFKAVARAEDALRKLKK